MVIITWPILSSFGISYMISSIYSSRMALRALAPVCFSIAISAMASRAPSSNSNFTSSIARSFWYCFKIAFLGSLRISTSISLVSPFKVKIIGRRPKNSGIMPNFLRSSTVTFSRMLSSRSYLSLRSAWNPIDAVLFRRSFIISSRSGKAPPQINRIFLVSTVVKGTMAFLLFAPTGTSISLPSKSFSIPCWTASPLTSL